MTRVKTWREFLYERLRHPRELRRAVMETHRHFFSDDDRRMFRRMGEDGWSRVYELVRRESTIYYPRDDRPEPDPPDYADPAALVMRRVWTPAHFLGGKAKR